MEYLNVVKKQEKGEVNIQINQEGAGEGVQENDSIAEDEEKKLYLKLVL
jgi:hypothetical protein